eukprot:GHVT01036495.1.p1 GENE.GHVT01036495.1~~GHVT01036495.1.p1  ORF type:complete len:157 (-),score=22.70 GHVT01036495.1:469-939(-)
MKAEGGDVTEIRVGKHSGMLSLLVRTFPLPPLQLSLLLPCCYCCHFCYSWGSCNAPAGAAVVFATTAAAAAAATSASADWPLELQRDQLGAVAAGEYKYFTLLNLFSNRTPQPRCGSCTCARACLMVSSRHLVNVFGFLSCPSFSTRRLVQISSVH